MSERERQITGIFHSALGREGAERRAFLDGACGGDAELRREVELLIESHEQAGSMLDAPAYERGAGLLGGGAGVGSLAGRTLGKYRLVSLLGAGGMGEVYLAHDTELKRAVALKFLPAEVTADPWRLERFEQEARAASSLNHPNILTVYEIGRMDSSPFFATEFVEGLTLREYLAARRPKLGEVLGLAAQVASTLVATHAAGVVHRDLKPENVMVRDDGYVKVVDFGLAKLAGAPAAGVDTEAATRALVNTEPGTVMGTVAYMSPEQARGEAVDARTDVWSLGVMLYEMLTGHLPFRGKSASHTIVAIQDEEPPPLSAYLPEVPDLLQEIVSDALSKDREARLTAKQMLSKLQRLKRRVEAGAHLDHSVAPNADAATATFSGPGGTSAPSQPGATTAVTGADPTAPDAQATRTNATAGRGGRRALFAGGLALLLLAALGYGLYRWAGREGPPARATGRMKISRLVTGAGDLGSVTISPEGKYIAYAHFKEGAVSLRVR